MYKNSDFNDSPNYRKVIFKRLIRIRKLISTGLLHYDFKCRSYYKMLRLQQILLRRHFKF